MLKSVHGICFFAHRESFPLNHRSHGDEHLGFVAGLSGRPTPASKNRFGLPQGLQTRGRAPAGTATALLRETRREFSAILEAERYSFVKAAVARRGKRAQVAASSGLHSGEFVLPLCALWRLA